jgi:murein L,D-transpeptidase YcbB/YkuD
MVGQEQFARRGGPRAEPGSALRLLSVVAILVNAACVATEPTPRTAAIPAVPSAVQEGPTATPARGKFVLVDIPSYELTAFQDGVPVLRSRVIVGRPQTPTPALVSSMFAIKFNPDWTPTPAMMRNEGLRYMPPGPNNPLGRILFELDNDQLVFLHDTNQKELFNRAERGLSHGCVRVEQARQLAAWALGVSVQEIDSMVARRTTYSVTLPDGIPVSLAYEAQLPDGYRRVAASPDVHASRKAAAGAPQEQASLATTGCPGAGN